MFKSVYDSPLVATLLPCIAAIIVVGLALLRKDAFVRAYGALFGVAIAADAYLNGPWTFVKSGTGWATAVSVLFVILGDFRYFVALEVSLQNARIWLRALGWAFIVPVTVQIVRWSVPRIEKDERATFLLYEISFFALAVAMRAARVPRAKNRKLAARVTAFELAQYGLWIAADVGLVATDADAFYAPRLAANLMYYVAFVPVTMRWLEST